MRQLGHAKVDMLKVDIEQGEWTVLRQLLGEEKYGLLKQRGGLLEPDAIAEHYWALHQQPKSAWSFESDLRPYAERW